MNLLNLAMDFSLDTFLESFNGSFQNWAGIIVSIIGAIMMLAGIWKIGKGFISDRAQTNWVMAIGAIVLGGLLLASGWTLLKDTSNGVAHELGDMGEGTSPAIVWMVD